MFQVQQSNMSVTQLNCCRGRDNIYWKSQRKLSLIIPNDDHTSSVYQLNTNTT